MEVEGLKAGYVISGIVLITLATVFAMMAAFLGLAVSFATIASTAVTTATSSPILSFYQSAFVITFAVGAVLYAVGVIFLWEGFKTTTPFAMRQYYATAPSFQQVPAVAPVQSTVAICPACKARVPADTNFCSQCGTELKTKPA